MRNRLAFIFSFTDAKARAARLWPALLALILAAVAFGRGDKMVAMAVAGGPQALADAAGVLSIVMQPVFLLPACLLLSVATCIRPGAIKLSRYGLFGFSCASASLIFALVLKHAFGRARPDAGSDLDPSFFRPFAFDDAFASLPSAQAACAAAVLIAAATSFPQLRGPFHFCALVLCGARVLSGEHWMSDVVIGWVIGWFAVLALSRFALPRDGTARG